MALTFITAWILILLGTVLGAGAAWLEVLGGSWAHGVAGIALVACGALLAVIGLWLLAPWIDRSLGEVRVVQASARSSWRDPRGWLAAAMLMVVAIAASIEVGHTSQHLTYDLRTGQRAWMHRHGTVRDQMPSVMPIPFPMGVASLGGPLITAGGVVFYRWWSSRRGAMTRSAPRWATRSWPTS